MRCVGFSVVGEVCQTPGATRCATHRFQRCQNEVHECNPDGTIGALVEFCPAGQCRDGTCRLGCAVGTDLIYLCAQVVVN